MSLIEFYGDGCSHCQEMKPKVEKLEEKEGVEVEKLEVWDNEENKEKYFEMDGDSKCGGVPYFYNTETEESSAEAQTMKHSKNGQTTKR